MRGYIIASYMVVTNSYTAGDNQCHDSMITPQLELVGTYCNKNISHEYLNIMNGQAHKIECHYYLISQVFLSVIKTHYTVANYPMVEVLARYVAIHMYVCACTQLYLATDPVRSLYSFFLLFLPMKQHVKLHVAIYVCSYVASYIRTYS